MARVKRLVNIEAVRESRADPEVDVIRDVAGLHGRETVEHAREEFGIHL
jgi:hypothetical protein